MSEASSTDYTVRKTSWILLILGSIIILGLGITAGVIENRKGDPDCQCLTPADRGWRAFSAVAISFGIPFFILMIIYGFSCDLAPAVKAQMGL